ncbi:hypothetical protein GFL49_13220 [Rhizobium leguminosarum bv. viciae]|nr:hypothetical protein [Rhizobium leguminosarum bv. viciae]
MVLTADATRRLSSQFRRFSCSPLEVYTFTINGPRFSVGPLFLSANGHPMKMSIADQYWSANSSLAEILNGPCDSLRVSTIVGKPVALHPSDIWTFTARGRNRQIC